MATKPIASDASQSSGFAEFSASVVPGLFAGLMLIVLSVSLAALIFSGPLATFLADGIAMSINAAIVVGIATALFSRCQPIVAQVDEDTAPIIALMATYVVASLPDHATSSEILTNIVVAIVVATTLAGVGLALLGAARTGRLIQYLPHSVLGGYFAALGWLLFVGGVQNALPVTEETVSLIDGVLHAPALASTAPAAIVCLALLVMRKRVSRALLLVGTVILSCVAWFGLAKVLGFGPDRLMSSGFLIGPLEQTGLPLIGLFREISIDDANWTAVALNSASIATIFLISLMSLLFSVSGIGMMCRNEPDLDRELKIAGLANVANGLSGGLLGLPSYNLSAQAYAMGAPPTRWAGVVAIATCLLAFFLAFELIGYTPRFVVAGLLMFLGANLMREWLIEGWNKFSPYEYVVIPIIVLSSIALGFLQGTLIGLIAAVVLFVVKYSRTRIVRLAASSESIGSNVERNAVAQQHLRDNGGRIYVLGLQGYLFFGTAGTVLGTIKERLDDPDLPAPTTVILDFSQVSGVDASAALNFQKIERLASQRGFSLIVAALEDGLRERLENGGFGQESGASLSFVTDLDRALEGAEGSLLRAAGLDTSAMGCFDQLREFVDQDESLDVFRTYLETRSVEEGTVLTKQGDLDAELYFVETCSVSAYIDQPDGKRLRVRTTEHGTIYGELGFYLGTPRSASVITDNAGTIYVLTPEAADRMEQDRPDLAAALHRYLAKILSERLLYTTQSLKAVTR